MADDKQLTALVSGGNRGIGLEACRQLSRAGLRVVLTSRDEAAGQAACRQLVDEGASVIYQQLDISLPRSVTTCEEELSRRGVHIDVLINNAGVYITDSLLAVSEENFMQSLQVNLIGAWRLCKAFVPGMMGRGYGRVVNVSSGTGQMTQPGGPSGGAYGLSKAGLNAMTQELASSVRGDIKVNAMCPGWVATRMGGAGAPRTPLQATETLVWLATLPADGPNGGFFRDKRSIAW